MVQAAAVRLALVLMETLGVEMAAQALRYLASRTQVVAGAGPVLTVPKGWAEAVAAVMAVN
jgi:hypothetical protein